MPLSPGARLGPYEILCAIGAGGMGEVYRARDSRLGRDVALKVLPEAFARDPDRMVRFEREAKVLALLNHPNIASLYGLEESNGARALVMELVEGLALSERIKQGSLPIGEALLLARQIAEGLEYAHERGHHSSRSETVEREADAGRPSENIRLWLGQSSRRREHRRGAAELADPERRNNSRGCAPRHRRVYVAGTSSLQARRPPNGYLGFRLCAL
jgi:hypothetical protein